MNCSILANKAASKSGTKNKSLSPDSKVVKTAKKLKKLEDSIEKYKIHVSILQNTNDNIVKENALLRLKCKLKS